MRVTRLADAVAYEAPNHFDVQALRLQGFMPDGPQHFWVGLSHIAPGGGAGPDSSSLEKVYVVLAGAVTVTAGGEEMVLGPFDSCTIVAHETREVRNCGSEPAAMLVVMPYPEVAK
jgi:mannose-6-phosphate isomerase-like protein (cupin superfamily)